MKAPKIDDYLALFRLYEGALKEPVEPRGERFELLFDQVIRLLHSPSPLNNEIPFPFRDVARRFSDNDAATVEHFRYDENRQFFLSDLYDFLHLLAAKKSRFPRGS
ncbi:hypothetical protein [Endothiovibrio diazotrophicus]